MSKSTKLRVYEIKQKVYLCKDIPVNNMLECLSKFIDCALNETKEWTKFHKENHFKLYCHDGLYPIESDKVYKAEHIYSFRIRTVLPELADYLMQTLSYQSTDLIKGLKSEIRILPKKMISELYVLTPAITRSADGYWRNRISILEYQKNLYANAIKKFNAFLGEKQEEDFSLFQFIFLQNQRPIPIFLKNAKLYGDKFRIEITDDPKAQELAYFLLGTGIFELNSRGYGFCGCR